MLVSIISTMYVCIQFLKLRKPCLCVIPYLFFLKINCEVIFVCDISIYDK